MRKVPSWEGFVAGTLPDNHSRRYPPINPGQKLFRGRPSAVILPAGSELGKPAEFY